MASGDDPRKAIEELLGVMAALRAEGGCPWDRRQTHRSLVPYLIEEAYEVVEAIESDRTAALREELGDLLFQVVFHSRLAEERGDFGFAQVAGDLARKLRDRHPHVFGGEPVESLPELNRLWHERKMAQRRSVLDGIPKALPALQQAAKVSRAAARAGFDWNDTGEILDKAAEELREFREVVESHGDGDPEMELGDLLFALVQLARWREIDPETALRRATRKFSDRFRWMESALRQDGEPPGRLSAEEWWALWAKAKAAHPG